MQSRLWYPSSEIPTCHLTFQEISDQRNWVPPPAQENQEIGLSARLDGLLKKFTGFDVSISSPLGVMVRTKGIQGFRAVRRLWGVMSFVSVAWLPFNQIIVVGSGILMSFLVCQNLIS